MGRKLLLGALVASIVVTGCSSNSDGQEAGPALGADSSCAVYMKASDSERSRALREVATQLSVPDAVTPAGMTQVDFNCVQQPDLTLGDSVALLAPGAAGDEPSDQATRPTDSDAIADATRALETYLSYDWRTIDEDAAAAEAASTPQFWAKSESLWQTLKDNVDETHTTSDASVIAIAPVGQDESGALFLAFVDQAATRNSSPPKTYRNTAYVTMAPGDTGWLVSDIVTASQPATPSLDPLTGEPVAVARRFVETVNTYGPDMLDAAGHLSTYADAVETLITDQFKAAFGESLRALEINVKQTGVVRTADISGAAAADMSDDRARVLVAGSMEQEFDGQRTDPVPLRLSVTLVREGDMWLVADFEPVTAQ